MQPGQEERRSQAACGQPSGDLLLNTDCGRFAARDFGGRGGDALLVHGTGHNLEVWEPLVERLRDDFRLMAFDLRGHGWTSVDSTDAEQYWRDIGAVISALGLDAPLLVGHSTGAYAVTAYAADGGDCAGVVMLDGFVLDARKTPQEEVAWRLPRETLWECFRYGWKASRDEMEAYVATVLDSADPDYEGIEPRVLGAVMRRAFVERHGAWLRRPSLDDLEAVCRSDAAANIYPEIGIYDRIGVPAGFVLAGRGSYSARRREVEALAADAGNRHFAEIDSGHNVHMQKPGEVAAFIANHFR
ncbi:MAG: alpha/beta hydrolase [Acidihalobacter sp.]